jgi:uncharacterized repeat protein (TIGR01451 family)
MKKTMTKKNLIKKGRTFVALAMLFSFIFSVGAVHASQSPSVTTHSATNIAVNSATLNGYVNPHNNATEAWFEWGTTSSLGEQTSKASYSASSAQYNRSLTGLSPNTTYYYRAVAQNAYGKTLGDLRNFTTSTSLPPSGQTPSVTTHSATNITHNSATLNGFIAPHDVSAQAWFVYGTSHSNLSMTTSKVSIGSSSTQFSRNITGLSPNTTYYFMAIGENSYGQNPHDVRSFTTGSQILPPTVDIKANGSNGPITINYNSSANLTWTSSNADSCYASNAWSGTKSTSGSQSTGNLTASRTYTITCSGPGGSASDSVTVNVEGQAVSYDFSVNKTIRNLSTATGYSKTVYASPGEILVFGIVVQAGSDHLDNVIVKDTIPAGLIYDGDLRIDNVLFSGDIINGLNIGSLTPGQKKTVTFRTKVAGSESFSFGQTEINNTAFVSSDHVSLSDTAKVLVIRTAIAGIATQVPTGLTNNVFLDSFLLPLIVTLLIIWLFKSRIVNFEQWLDSRKKEYQVYKSRKILQMKVARIKAKEFFQKII